MKNPNIKTKVVHSQTKAAWNVVGETLGGKYKIARVPYVVVTEQSVSDRNRIEAWEHAEFISYCFNHSGVILTNGINNAERLVELLIKSKKEEDENKKQLGKDKV